MQTPYSHPFLPAGNLDASQQKALREMYRRFFELTDRNKEVSEALEKKGGPTKADGAGKPVATGKDEKDAGKDIPKGDAAKEEAKKAEEMKDMNAFLDKYGGPYLRRAVWEFCKHDHPDASMLRFLRARKVSRRQSSIYPHPGHGTDSHSTHDPSLSSPCSGTLTERWPCLPPP